MLKLFEGDIEDLPTERSFRELLKFVNTQPFLKGTWRRMEIVIDGAKTNYKVEHQLGVLVTDFILTYESVGGALTVNYANFTDTYLDFTTSSAVTIRFFVGRYSE